MKIITGFFMAWGNFCAVPCPYRRWEESARKHMLAELPLIGLLMGLLWYGIWRLFDGLMVPLPLTAAVLTAYPFMISGFIHLDGYMDCSDAILSRRPMEDRQRILKDSHVGAFAVITTLLLFLFFFAGQLTLTQGASDADMTLLVVIPMISRALSVRQVLVHKPLAVSQYSTAFEKGKNTGFVWCVNGLWILAAVFGIALWGIESGAFTGETGRIIFPFGVILIQTIVSLAAGAYGRKQLGGMNGDISGYCIVWCELAAVLTLALGQ